MSMGSRIRGKREEMGLTLVRLADVLDVSFQAVSNWERDINLPDTQKLGDIAKALNTTIDYLMGEQGDFPDWDSEDRPPGAGAQGEGWHSLHQSPLDHGLSGTGSGVG